jgi:putative inorganic carbon (HCO3(-)) transporter
MDWGEVVLLATLAPFFIFPVEKKIWLLFIFPIFWGLRGILKRPKDSDCLNGCQESTLIDAAVLLLLTSLFISCLSIAKLHDSSDKIIGVVFGVLVLKAARRLLKTTGLARLGLAVFLAGGIIFAIVGMMGMFFISDPLYEKVTGKVVYNSPRVIFGFRGAEGGFNPNAVAGVMMLFVPLIIMLLPEKRDRRGRKIAKTMVFGVLSIFCLVVLYRSQSVGSWIALAVGLFILLPSIIQKALGALFLGIFLICLMIRNPIRTAGSLIADESILASKMNVRLKIWNEGIIAIKEHPNIGIGLNQLRRRKNIFYEDSHAHNQLLHTGAELGLPGLIAYMAILGGVGFACHQVRRNAKELWMRTAARGLGAGQAAFFVFGLGDAIPLGAKPGIFFWVSLALILSLYNLMLESQGTRIVLGRSESDPHEEK